MKTPMRGSLLPFILFVLVLAGVAYSQTTVKSDQGRPGNQGSWPVTITGGSGSTSIVIGPDGGAVVVSGSVFPGQCRQTTPDGGSPYSSVSVGAAAVLVPTLPAAGRAYVEICNSLQNTGTPLLKCRADGIVPVMAVTNAGDVLGIGDCYAYSITASNPPQCIADAASTNALVHECVPLP